MLAQQPVAKCLAFSGDGRLLALGGEDSAAPAAGVAKAMLVARITPASALVIGRVIAPAPGRAARRPSVPGRQAPGRRP